MNEDGNIIKQTLKGPILVPVRLKCDAKLNFSTDGLNATSHYSPAAFGTSLIAGSGVKAIISIIENNGGKRCFWPSEKLVINQMKEWSPLEDLQVVHAALTAQKDILLQRIRDCDPTFVEPISSAKSIRNASSWISKKSSFEEKKISLQIPKKSEDYKVPIVEGKSVLNHLIEDEASMDVGADFSLLSDDVINDLDLDEDMMAVDISKNLLNCEDTLNIGASAGVDGTFKDGIHLGDEEIKIDEDDEGSKIGEEEGEEDEESKLEEEEGEEDEESKVEEEEGEDDEESKLEEEEGEEDEESKLEEEEGEDDEESKLEEEENDDEESKIEDEDVEDKEEFEEGDGENQRDREEIEDDDDESKEGRDRVCSEGEDEGVDGFDFQDAGMIKQNIDDEDAAEDEEQAGEEEDSSCDEESSEVADPDS